MSEHQDTPGSVVTIRGLSVAFGRHQAVRGVDLSIGRGEFLALVGASGSGKTTLLRTINALVRPTTGEVSIDGHSVLDQPSPTLRRKIGWVIQGVGLLPHRTVAENVAIVPSLLGWSPANIHAAVASTLEMVNLPVSEFGARTPDTLSGGQRQRVGVARALAARPPLVLMDEPFGALDPVTREELHGELRRLHRELGFTCVLVTHDMAEALLLADRVAVLEAGELVALDTPAALLRGQGSEHWSQHTATMIETPARQAAALMARGVQSHDSDDRSSSGQPTA